MAAEYEVNISLNTKTINAQLNTLEKRLSNISKAADPLGSGPGGTRRSRNLDRIRATGVIINRLGRDLNKLEAQGVKVQNERRRIKRAVAKLDKGLVETARAHVVEIRDFVKEANKGLKTKEKTVKFDSVQNKFSERRLRALARSNERNEKDLRLNQRMTAEARARMRLLSQSGAKGFDATRPQGRQMADDIDARLKAQEKSARLANRINELEVKGVNVAKHRKQLGKIRTAQADSSFGLAEREIRVLRKSLELEQSKLRILKEQSNAVKTRQAAGLKLMGLSGKAGRLAGRAEAIAISEQAQLALPSAKMLGGEARGLQRIETAGELRLRFAERVARAEQRSLEANKEALKVSKASAAAGAKRAQAAVDEAKAAQSAGIALRKLASRFTPLINRASKLSGDGAGGLLALPSTKQLAAQARGIKRIETSEERRARFVERRLRAEERSAQNNKKALETSKQSARAAERAARATERQAEATAKQSRLRAKKRLEGVALGAGFPLLFGGGAGSILGGGLGGLTGSFGAQIALSALGGQLDNFFAAVQESANRVSAALDGTSASLEAVKETGIAVQSSTIEYIQQLENSGRSLDAYNAVQRELNNIYGVEGVTVLRELKGANEFLNTEAGKLTAVLQTELAPVFILLAQLGGGAARGIRELIPAIADAIGEFTLGIPGATTTAQLSRKLPGSDPALIAAGKRQRAEELRTDAEIETITAGTEALRRQTQIVQLNNDLTDERVVALRKAEITTKAQNKITALSAKATKDIFNTDLARLTQAEIQKVRQQETLDLARLEVSTREAIAAKVEKAAAEQERAARAAQRAADKAEKARMKELQDRIDIASRERQKELDLEASFQDRIKSIGDQNTLLRGQLEGDEDRVRKQLQINNLVNKFGENKRGQIELLINEQYQLKEQISLLTEQERLYAEIGQTIQSGIVGGIQGAIDGSRSLGESLSGILKQLGGIFLRTAIGAPGSGGQAGTGLFGALGFASGGFVSGATPAVVGEAGPEYIIPESKMRSAMSRYSRGARGAAVIPEGSGAGTSGEGGGTAVAAPIDVRFNVERINNVDYVTAEQFQVGLQQAAQQGAAEGERRAMGSLRNSAAVRRRIGV